MAHLYRNRVTVFFDGEKKSFFRVYLATLEQVHVFMHYFKRCTQIPYNTCLQEFYKDTWIKSCEREADSDVNHSNAKRFEAAPFRLTVTQWETKNMPRVEFSFYFFSRFDSDFVSTLIELGTSREQIKLTSYNRDHTTGDWVIREVDRFAPRAVAELYSSLSPQGKESAIAELSKLKQLS